MYKLTNIKEKLNLCNIKIFTFFIRIFRDLYFHYSHYLLNKIHKIASNSPYIYFLRPSQSFIY